MKITMESKDISSSVEVPHDDVCMDEVWDLMKQVCMGYGFHPNTVAEASATPREGGATDG